MSELNPILDEVIASVVTVTFRRYRKFVERIDLKQEAYTFVYAKAEQFNESLAIDNDIQRGFNEKKIAWQIKRHLERYRSSGVNGHTHRLGSYSVTDMHGRSHTWYEQGCLCRRDLEYVRGVGNWQQGFLIGTVANGALHPQLIHTIEADSGRGFYAGGRYYSIKDS